MSYDYYFFLLTRPIESLRECDESAVAEFTDWEKVYATLRQRYPDLEWTSDAEGYRSHADAIVGGRFEIIIDFDTAINEKYNRPYGRFHVRGSFHADPLEMIRDNGEAVNFSAFDLQTGERIYLQSFSNESGRSGA